MTVSKMTTETQRGALEASQKLLIEMYNAHGEQDDRMRDVILANKEALTPAPEVEDVEVKEAIDTMQAMCDHNRSMGNDWMDCIRISHVESLIRAATANKAGV